MKTFAEKQNEHQQKSSANLAGQNTPVSPSNQQVHPLLDLQRTMGNQAVLRSLSPGVDGLVAGPTTGLDSDAPATARFAHDFSGFPVHAPAPITIQPKLTVNTPGDVYEQEADHIAEQVMSMPESHVVASPTSASGVAGVQRACACGGTCPDCQKPSEQESAHVQMKAAGPATGGIEAPPIVQSVLRSPGQPLDKSTRSFMEPRFGHDFSGVRIHTDAEAAHSAQQLHASAYTVGDHIVFGEGRLASSTPAGDKLLAHELAHVVQGAGQNTILRRQPVAKGPPDPEAILRVRITDALEATKNVSLNEVVSAIERGDRAFLGGLGLTSEQMDHLLNRTSSFDRTFGIALERRMEQAVRADPFLSQYVKQGPTGRVPRGVGKPDWIIETPSSTIRVELTTREQLEEKLAMWRRQAPRGKPKWYVEKGLNLTYDIPSIRPVTSSVKAVGRFLAREAPGLALQAALMILFPPSVNFHHDKAEELSEAKLNPGVQNALAEQEPVFDKLQADDATKSIYANVKARLDYAVDAGRGGNLELFLKEVTFVELKITNQKIDQYDAKLDKTSPKNVTKQITYSIVLYKSWVDAQREYQECVQQHGTGSIPPAAGIEDYRNPEEGPCIPPH